MCIRDSAKCVWLADWTRAAGRVLVRELLALAVAFACMLHVYMLQHHVTCHVATGCCCSAAAAATIAAATDAC
eukprot:9015635-Alexandrium_andersonii.AAC.1